jgi:hypothetical protein
VTRDITGTQLQDRVFDYAAILGLHIAHFRPARLTPDPKTGQDRWRTAVERDGKGWPDAFIIGARFMWRELKGTYENVSDDQRKWLDWLQAAGGDADVWRPADWDSQRIHQELQALRRANA